MLLVSGVRRNLWPVCACQGQAVVKSERREGGGGGGGAPAPDTGGDPADPGSAVPRTGSMAVHQDDVVTRVKNVQMIELGKHRIKPWYFAPYPQVGSIPADTRRLAGEKRR